GMKWINEKTSVETPSRTGIVSTRRRVRKRPTAGSPAELKHPVQRGSDGDADGDHRGDGLREIRVDHEQNSAHQLRISLLLPSIGKEHEPDSTRNQRQQEDVRVEIEVHWTTVILSPAAPSS